MIRPDLLYRLYVSLRRSGKLEELGAYLENRLSPADEALVQDYVEASPELQRLLDDMKEMDSAGDAPLSEDETAALRQEFADGPLPFAWPGKALRDVMERMGRTSPVASSEEEPGDADTSSIDVYEEPAYEPYGDPDDSGDGDDELDSYEETEVTDSEEDE